MSGTGNGSPLQRLDLRVRADREGHQRLPALLGACWRPQDTGDWPLAPVSRLSSPAARPPAPASFYLSSLPSSPSPSTYLPHHHYPAPRPPAPPRPCCGPPFRNEPCSGFRPPGRPKQACNYPAGTLPADAPLGSSTWGRGWSSPPTDPPPGCVQLYLQIIPCCLLAPLYEVLVA